MTTTALLGDLVKVVGGGTPTRNNPEFYGGDIPWVTPKDMKSSTIAGSLVTLTKAGLAESPARLVPSDSVLVVVRSGVLKHTIPVALNSVPVALNQDMKALICGSAVSPAFLARFIKWSSPEILQWVRATTADNFPIDNLKNLEVPLPPMEEQRRIAAILDQADALRAKRREALAHLDDLTQSIFLDTFGDLQTDDTPSITLGEVTHIASGITKGRMLGDLSTHLVPYLAVSNVQDGRLDLSSVKEIAASASEIERYRLRSGDLVLTEGGDPDKLGRGTVWNDELPLCIHQNHIFRVRIADSEQLHPTYLSQSMSGRTARAYFLRSAKQTTGIASINMTQLRGLPVVVPPHYQQLEFVGRAEAVRQQMCWAKDHVAAMDSLFASLQSRAFAGEL